jgi:hypothetical protein
MYFSPRFPVVLDYYYTTVERIWFIRGMRIFLGMSDLIIESSFFPLAAGYEKP